MLSFIEAVGIDPQQHVHAVASPLGNTLWFDARPEPCGDAGVPQVIRALRERRGHLGISEREHAGLRPHSAVGALRKVAAVQAVVPC